MENSKRRCVSNHKGRVQKKAVHFPPEIICEILSRLAIESILICRSVCKAWYNLTREPYFINLQLNQTSNQPPRFILQSGCIVGNKRLHLLDTEEQKSRQIPFKEMDLPARLEFQLPNLRIICSCNGLLCMVSEDRLDPVVICNPVTGECTILPMSGLKKCLVSHQLGFYFDPSSGKYKVVREYKECENYEVSRFQIVALGESSWRDLSTCYSLLECRMCEAAVFWNGAIYWKVGDSDDEFANECIVAFDIIDEKFYAISFPENFSFEPTSYELVVLKGCLTLVECFPDEMSIWKVTGNKVDGFSLCYQDSYNMYVRHNPFVHYEVIWQPNDSRFLLKIQTEGGLNSKQKLGEFFPRRRYSYCFDLDIPGIPPHFRAVCFKPSLVSPLAASHVSNPALSLEELYQSIFSEWENGSFNCLELCPNCSELARLGL